MDISYDKVADALYIIINSSEVKESENLNDNVIIDYDKEGKLIGIEILNFSKQDLDLNKMIKMSQDEIIAQVASA